MKYQIFRKLSFKSVFFLAVILEVFLSTHTVFAGVESQITGGTDDQLYPAISGDKIVWWDLRDGGTDIYMRNLTTQIETRISSGFGFYNPAIDGNKVVWVDYRNGFSNSAIYMYDLSIQTETLISIGAGIYYNPQISGDKIVWFDNRNSHSDGNTDIYVYDLVTHTETQITSNPTAQYYPQISGDKIVWEDYRNGNANIYMYNLTTQTETRITTNMAGQGHPSISGDKIVWEDYRNMRDDGNADIYMYDLITQTETRITTNASWQGSPVILGNRIFWTDNRNGNGDIYMYDLTTHTETRITTDVAQARNLQISGNKIVWQDYRNGNADIYMYDLNPNVSPVAQISPVSTITFGQTGAFDGSSSSDSDGTITSYHWDFGDGLSADGITANHTYSSAGTYQVMLTVTDDDGATANTVASVLVNAPPVAVITPLTTKVLGDAVICDGSASSDLDGSITNYHWDFGDGVTGNGITLNHTYTTAGSYQVRLTVADNNGATASATTMVRIDTPPIARIIPVATVILGEVTTFDGSTSIDSDGTITNYSWNFGDGTNAIGSGVTHTYISAGSYQAMLTVTDNDGATDTAVTTVMVQTSSQAINNLISLVQSMNLAQGITNSLDTKLQNADDALSAENADNRNDAISKLQAFISATQAQSGNKLTTEQADQLISMANRIIETI